jgi:hypothetical protein
MLERKLMSAPDGPVPSNVVQLHPAPSDALAVVLRTQEAYRRACLEVVAVRIEWLASGVSCWPDALLTREHLLTQLHTLAEGARRIGDPAPAVPPAPTNGDAA